MDHFSTQNGPIGRNKMFLGKTINKILIYFLVPFFKQIKKKKNFLKAELSGHHFLSPLTQVGIFTEKVAVYF